MLRIALMRTWRWWLRLKARIKNCVEKVKQFIWRVKKAGGLWQWVKKTLKRFVRLVGRLRGYESRRLRNICFYHNYTGGLEAVRKAKEVFSNGSRQELLRMIVESRDVVSRCYVDGLLNHGTELRAMLEVLNIYERIARRYWIIVKLYDIKIKIWDK